MRTEIAGSGIYMERCRSNPIVWDIYDERRGRVHVGAATELERGFAVHIWYRATIRFHARNLSAALQEATMCVERLPA